RSLSENLETPEVEIRQALASATKEIAASTFAQTPATVLLNIWKWGFDPRYFSPEDYQIDDYYQNILDLLLTGIFKQLTKIEDLMPCMNAIAQYVIANSAPDAVDATSGLAEQSQKAEGSMLLPETFDRAIR
ncbi:MAG: hypothetical protein F6K28_31140, partial [Microcoleus sp. SIO2G3]|nr:hypothetical protein [Microcoleus sp. SIO2G3]